MIGKGEAKAILKEADVQELLAKGFDRLVIDNQRVLVIIPDGTRTAPIPMFFRAIYEQIGRRVQRLDYLIALGTHPPMSEQAIDRLVGVNGAERRAHYPNVEIYNHQWDQPLALETVGIIPGKEVAAITGGLVDEDIHVRLNCKIKEYDQLIICGPVFPHEVAGFSGGYKYFFPGIAGPEIINATHWLGGLVTSIKTIGIKDTPVRRVIHRAAELVNRPTLCLAMVLQGQDLHGLYIGEPKEAWSAAADLSAELNILTVARAFK